MICYRDMTFCSKMDCANLKCKRTQRGIDDAHWKASGELPLSIADMWRECNDHEEIEDETT